MSSTDHLARPLLAGIFIHGGLDAARSPKAKVDAANTVVPHVMRALGLEFETEKVVRVNGVAQVVAGAMLAAGYLPRVAASALLASLVPTTLAGHRFWELEGDERSGQEVHFLKNMAVVGGLLAFVRRV